jgi:hypothetical protein
MIDLLPATGRATLGAFGRRLSSGVGPMHHHAPLPRLSDVHPGSPTSGRWIGFRTVPTGSIRGTASTVGSRGPDFRPLAGREPADWRFRWSRLHLAERDQTPLPPIQLLRAGDDYWVVDGHNRVALAKEHGQLWIDAEITELDLSSHSAATAAKEN